MINPITGHLKVNAQNTIIPNMLREDFESLKLESISTYKSKEIEIIQSKNTKIDEYYFNLNFHFYSGKLKHTTFTFQSEMYSENQGWANWSQAKEMENLERFKIWIQNIFGNNSDLEWGKIKALYDTKTGMSLIEVNYKPMA